MDPTQLRIHMESMRATTALLRDIAIDRGLQIFVEPSSGIAGELLLPDGTRRFFRSHLSDLNGAAAAEIATNKAWASYFLETAGYPVPEGRLFFRDDWCAALGSDDDRRAAWTYAQTLGLPVITKPNSGHGGDHVWLVHNYVEFVHAIDEICQADTAYLVQRYVPGIEYRVVVLDGAVISAYQRQPLTVVGDGTSTIEALLAAKQDSFIQTGRATHISAADPRLTLTLTHLGMTMSTVLEAGHAVALLPIANLNAGGEAIEVTDILSPAWNSLAGAIASALNLRLAGLDIVVSHTLADSPEDYTVLEVNAAPAVWIESASQDEMEALRPLYEQLLSALVAPSA